MEPVVATSGNQSQTRRVRKRLKRTKTIAVRRDQLRSAVHGKEALGLSGTLWLAAKRELRSSRTGDPPVLRVPENVDRVPGDVPDSAVVDQVAGLVEQGEGREVAGDQRVGTVEEQLALA